MQALSDIIRPYYNGFVLFGHGLLKIQTEQLWRQGNYATFDAYCKEVWGFGRSRASQIVSATQLVQQHPRLADLNPNERVVRELASGIEPELVDSVIDLLYEVKRRYIDHARQQSPSITVSDVKIAKAVLQEAIATGGYVDVNDPDGEQKHILKPLHAATIVAIEERIKQQKELYSRYRVAKIVQGQESRAVLTEETVKELSVDLNDIRVIIMVRKDS